MLSMNQGGVKWTCGTYRTDLPYDHICSASYRMDGNRAARNPSRPIGEAVEPARYQVEAGRIAGPVVVGQVPPASPCAAVVPSIGVGLNGYGLGVQYGGSAAAGRSLRRPVTAGHNRMRNFRRVAAVFRSLLVPFCSRKFKLL